MWNKFAELAQDQSFRRLLLTLLVSIVLHAILFGGLDLSLPFLKKEMHVIEARIQMPQAKVKQLEPAKLAPEVPKPDSNKEKPKKRLPKPKVEEAIKQEPPEALQPEPMPEVSPLETAAEPVAVEEEKNVAEKIEPVQEPQPIDQGLLINENAYKYVETYFDVRTKADGPVQGKATAVFNAIDNEHYKLNFLIEVDGVAALFIPNLVQTSEGQINKSGLQPNNYAYQFGNKTEKNRKAVFDWQTKTLQLITNSETKTEPLVDGTQDVISFMYQFMYVAPLQKMELNITNGKKLREYDYAFEGEENINTPFGEIKTYHIAHTGADTDEKTELWLAIDYQFVPVKIRRIDKEGKMYEFTATRINTTRPFAP